MDRTVEKGPERKFIVEPFDEFIKVFWISRKDDVVQNLSTQDG